MQRELVIAAGPGEWRAALLEDGAAVELLVERGEGGEAGSLHLGRVLQLLPALGAALVDIGADRPAFLPQSGIVPRGRRLDEGERLVVQIRREAQGGKAAQLTSAVVLRGRSVELMAGRPGIVGGDALPPEMRAQILAVVGAGRHPPADAGPSLPPGHGGGLGWRPTRSAVGLRLCAPAPFEAVVAEAAGLVQCWRDIIERAAHLDPPARLDPPASFAAALAGRLAAPDRILVDEPAMIPQIRAAFAGTAVAHEPESRWPIDLDALFDRALAPTIALTGGGSVHFEAARAALLIDVDTGTPQAGTPERAALAVNLAAAAMIARQLRMRNLGGAIVVDFVGSDDRGARARIGAALAANLVADPARPQILGWTRLGHLELVRARRGRPLAEALLETPPGGSLVKTAATVAFEALRALRREARAQPGRRWRLTVAPEVAAALAGGAAGALRALEQRLGRPVTIAAEPGRARERFEITPQ